MAFRRITRPAARTRARHSATGKSLSGAADSSGGSIGTKAAAADSGATIDVMVVYSNQTAAAAGAGIGAQIQQAVDTANAVYANSGITTRLRLVYSGPANYNESGDFGTDLNWLTGAAGVATLRNTYGADLVSLFIENGQYCGMAWIGPSASYRVQRDQSRLRLGQLQLPARARPQLRRAARSLRRPGTSPYAYGHGITDTDEGWRDVMAYNNACAAARHQLHPHRLLLESEPDLRQSAAPAGHHLDLGRGPGPQPECGHRRQFPRRGHRRLYLHPVAHQRQRRRSRRQRLVQCDRRRRLRLEHGLQRRLAHRRLPAPAATASGTLNYTWAANTGVARSGTFTVGGQTFTVNQASGCSYSLTPTSASVAAGGGSGTTSLTTTSGCPWTASSSASWLTLTSATSGSGNATVSYTVAANTGAVAQRQPDRRRDHLHGHAGGGTGAGHSEHDCADQFGQSLHGGRNGDVHRHGDRRSADGHRGLHRWRRHDQAAAARSR